MPKPLKLISLNIEGDNHLDMIIPFLQKEKADVICMQEVLSIDIPRIKDNLKMYVAFVPLMNIKNTNDQFLKTQSQWGIAIFSKNQPTFSTFFYKIISKDVPEYLHPNSNNRALLTAKIIRHKTEYNIGTTHFTWTPDGLASDEQRKDIVTLFEIFKENKVDDLVLCGDFNAPRGGEIFSYIKKKFTDNIPHDVTTTIDGNLHKHGNLQLVVDGLFSTAKYKVENVQVIGGLSDHMAISANIEKIC